MRRRGSSLAQLGRSLLLGAVGAVVVGTAGCTTGTGMSPEPDPGPDNQPDVEPDAVPCTYPEAPAVMALDQPLPAFSWPTALDGARNDHAIALERAYCDDEDIDWSPFDVLLFISIPAW